MWKVVELDPTAGSWKEHGRFATPDECRAQVASFSKAQDNVYAFWDGAWPADVQSQNKILDEVQQANGGRISRFTVGLDLSAIQKVAGSSSCPGRCFCVIAHGMRRCEVYYCNVNNVCAWVPCGMNC